jgi:RNA polymerase sigma-70 factor (ECF subfamily)
LLCRFEGLKYSQIASKLNISVKTVEMQMGIALKKLRSKLSDLQIVRLMMCIFLKKKQESLQGISSNFRLLGE